MAISKERKNDLLRFADEVIRNNHSVYDGHQVVSESFNGQIAAFSVSVALSGLKPAMALYYSNTGSSEIDKKQIIELLAGMYSMDKGTQHDAKSLYNSIVKLEDNDVPAIKKLILEYAIALKLAIRTFKFKK